MIYRLLMAVFGVGLLLALWVGFERLTRGNQGDAPGTPGGEADPAACSSCRLSGVCGPSAR